MNERPMFSGTYSYNITGKHLLIGTAVVVGAIFLLRRSPAAATAAAKIRASGGVQNVT